MEMAGKFPVLKSVGYTDAKVMRASENDLAWSHRSKVAGASPRSPPGKKPIRESPRARAFRGFQEMNISEDSSLLVQTSSAVRKYLKVYASVYARACTNGIDSQPITNQHKDAERLPHTYRRRRCIYSCMLTHVVA